MYWTPDCFHFYVTFPSNLTSHCKAVQQRQCSFSKCIWLCCYAAFLIPKFTHPSRIDSLQQYRLSNFCFVTESFTFIAGTHSFPALDSWYNLKRRQRKVERFDFTLVCVVLVVLKFILLGSNLPVNPSDTLLHNAPDLLEYIGVFLVHPVCQVSSIIKDLTFF